MSKRKWVVVWNMHFVALSRICRERLGDKDGFGTWVRMRKCLQNKGWGNCGSKSNSEREQRLRERRSGGWSSEGGGGGEGESRGMHVRKDK